MIISVVLQAEKTTSDRVLKMVQLLLRKDDASFWRFLAVLSENGHEDVTELLQKDSTRWNDGRCSSPPPLPQACRKCCSTGSWKMHVLAS